MASAYSASAPSSASPSTALSGLNPSPSSSAAFLPSVISAASMGAFAASPSSAGDSPDTHTHSHGFFTSNHPRPAPPASAAPSAAAPQHAQAFLPPLQPASAHAAVHPARKGATLLSDEDTPSDSGSVRAGAGSSSSSAFAPPPPPALPASMLANLPPLAPAPAGAASTSASGATPAKPPRSSSRGSSSTPAPGAGVGSAAKGKAKAKDGGAAGGAGGEKKKPAAGAGGKKRNQVVGADGKPVPKKKKAGRACARCQAAHLTCDDSRPCARCVKKGCPEECIDGARKKAKYLQEIPDELLERGRHPGAPGGAPGTGDTAGFNGTPLLDQAGGPSQPTLADSPSLGPSVSLAPAPPIQQAPQPFFDFTPTSTAPQPASTAYDSFLSFPSTTAATSAADSLVDTTAFGSEAANLEYAILSSMLNGNGFALDAHTTPPGFGSDATALRNGGLVAGGDDPMLLDPGTGASGGPLAGSTPAPAPIQGGPSGDPAGATPSASAGASGEFAPSPASASGVAGLLTAEEAYRSVTKPYPYAQSYHFLVKHLKERFEKNDILRIIRALATFRPSLIALQMPLTEEDETFVERTFQRTLVELNKLISFSGTPTVVWRRTGEICLVGTEFCLLTGWKREELVGKKYIFELFDTASVVEYYESFAKHAFESTATSITMQCVVLAPDGRPVPCAFCFSVRRDLFSCPFLVIGSFLPVLV